MIYQEKIDLSIPVVVTNLKGEEIGEYESASQCARKLYIRDAGLILARLQKKSEKPLKSYKFPFNKYKFKPIENGSKG